MRSLVVHMQTTLDNRIAKADGTFWEPFPWGEEEMAWINGRFRAADTWALAPLAAAPGLIDEYLLVVHPAVITTGPRLFEQLAADLALRLLEAKSFDGGAVVLRYAVVCS